MHSSLSSPHPFPVLPEGSSRPLLLSHCFPSMPRIRWLQSESYAQRRHHFWLTWYGWVRYPMHTLRERCPRISIGNDLVFFGRASVSVTPYRISVIPF